ncbi:hypothetical protein KY311_05235 [Candidatus Woesearchaeota archaeon]|nr:hypothetical protein [Candidatus Woesearchaeota archaeon]
MKIDSTSFGKIVIEGQEFAHDVWIFADGSIRHRDKNHKIDADEIELLSEPKPDYIVIGTGQSGVAKVTSEARELAMEKGINLMIAETPDAINIFNELSDKKVAGIFHLTC